MISGYLIKDTGKKNVRANDSSFLKRNRCTNFPGRDKIPRKTIVFVEKVDIIINRNW